jgi:hypothetical protein
MFDGKVFEEIGDAAVGSKSSQVINNNASSTTRLPGLSEGAMLSVRRITS